ncbi:unnamed protein product [Urochloa humidicola]
MADGGRTSHAGARRRRPAQRPSLPALSGRCGPSIRSGAARLEQDASGLVEEPGRSRRSSLHPRDLLRPARGARDDAPLLPALGRARAAGARSSPPMAGSSPWLAAGGAGQQQQPAGVEAGPCRCEVKEAGPCRATAGAALLSLLSLSRACTRSLSHCVGPA